MYDLKKMTTAGESKLPFLILIPFVFVVYFFASQSGTPSEPYMPGVVTPQKAPLRETVDLSKELEAVEAEQIDDGAGLEEAEEVETQLEEEASWE